MKEFDVSLYKKVMILKSINSPHFNRDNIFKSDLVLYKQSEKAYVVYKDDHGSFDSKTIKIPYSLIARAMLGYDNIFIEGE